MTTDNISIVFAPTLFSSSDPNPLASLQYSSALCGLLKRMIERQDAIAQGVRKNVESKTNKKVVNADALFQAQHLVGEMYKGYDGEGLELEEEELEAIKELLEDDLESVPYSEIPADLQEACLAGDISISSDYSQKEDTQWNSPSAGLGRPVSWFTSNPQSVAPKKPPPPPPRVLSPR